MSNLIHAATTVAAGVPDIAPRFDGPWMPTIQNVTGLALGTFLVILIVAVGIGVLVDTLVVRTVIVPAIFSLAGDRIWWPGKLHARQGESTHESRTPSIDVH